MVTRATNEDRQRWSEQREQPSWGGGNTRGVGSYNSKMAEPSAILNCKTLVNCSGEIMTLGR
jgi:hypothetical protein